MEIAGDPSRSIGDLTFVTGIFSFRTVKERRRLVEMVKRSILSRFEGGTGGSDHRTEITDKSNRRTHIGNHTLLIVSLLEHYSYLMYSARIELRHNWL